MVRFIDILGFFTMPVILDLVVVAYSIKVLFFVMLVVLVVMALNHA